MIHSRLRNRTASVDPDLIADDVAVFVVRDVAGVRDVRAQFLNAAMWLQLHDHHKACTVFSGKLLTSQRMADEVQKFGSIVRDDIIQRMGVAEWHANGLIPFFPESNSERELPSVWRTKDFSAKVTGLMPSVEQIQTIIPGRAADARFVILQAILGMWLHNKFDNHSLKSRDLTRELIKTTGYSYVTVTRNMKQIHEYVKALDPETPVSFPKPDLAIREMMALAPLRRSTRLFTDISGIPRSANLLARNFSRMKRKDMAVGGILGAKFHVPDLDVSGLPRLDISVHSHQGWPALDFVHDLDPGLRECEANDTPILAVHVTQRRESGFIFDHQSNIWIADPIECLLDLDEIAISGLAISFLEQCRMRTVTLSGNEP